MASLPEDIAADEDWVHLLPEEDDYMDMEEEDQEWEEEEEEEEEEGDDYDDDENSFLHIHQDEEDQDGHPHNMVVNFWILEAGEARLNSVTELQAADIIPPVGGVTAALDEDDPAVAEALRTVEAPSADGRDCPICLQDDGEDATATATAGEWKETPCGHRFHGRCVERWLRAEGSCPMCRHQVVTVATKPATTGTGSAASSLYSALAVFLQMHRQNAASME